MGYFLIVPEQIAPASGNTVSAEGTVTADLISIECVQDGTIAPTMRYTLSSDSVETSASGALELSVFGLRELYSIETSYTDGMDIARGLTVINEAGVVSTDTNVLRFYGDTLYSGSTLGKRSDATITTDGQVEIDGGGAPTRTFAGDIDGGDVTNSEQEIDGGSA